jgi:hypothetical protein
MKGSVNHDALEEYLRSAKPRLICRTEINGANVKITPFISEADNGSDEILAEGYDSKHSPLGCPVYWRIVKRGNKQFYCSTFQVPPHHIVKAWGDRGLAYCDPVTGMAVARIESHGSAAKNEIPDDVRSAAAGRASSS